MQIVNKPPSSPNQTTNRSLTTEKSAPLNIFGGLEMDFGQDGGE